MNDAELARVSTIVRDQWDRLRTWLDDVDPHDERPSVLDGWAVADLVAHLARCHRVIPGAVEAPEGTSAQSLAEYLHGYAADAELVAAGTREQKAEISADPLAAIDQAARRAWEALDDFGPHDRVVLAKRGPVLLSDLVVTRAVELVVHADDLARSLGLEKPPVTREALGLVAEAFLDIIVTRGGWDLEVVDPLLWVRLAAGRRPYDVDELAEALRARHTSDSVPDLGTYLPVV